MEVARGDVTDPASLPAAVRGCDLVFHLAGIRRAPRREDFLRVNAEGTRLLLEACTAHAPGLSRFVLCGSLASVGPSATPRSEDAPFAPREWYGESKAEAERLTLAFAGRMPVTIARPPRITGPGDKENLLFFRIAAKGILLAFGRQHRPALLRGRGGLRPRDGAPGQPPRGGRGGLLPGVAGAHQRRGDPAGDGPGAWRDDTRTVNVPPGLLRGLASLADVVSRLTGRQLPLNRKLAEQLLAPGWACDPGKARRVLGFEARVDLEESVRRSAEWYRKVGWIRKA